MICVLLGCDPADVIIALDSSGSIGRDNYYEVLNFTKSVVSALNINGRHTLVGLETFANDVEVKFDLQTYPTKFAVNENFNYQTCMLQTLSYLIFVNPTTLL